MGKFAQGLVKVMPARALLNQWGKSLEDKRRGGKGRRAKNIIGTIFSLLVVGKNPPLCVSLSRGKKRIFFSTAPLCAAPHTRLPLSACFAVALESETPFCLKSL